MAVTSRAVCAAIVVVSAATASAWVWIAASLAVGEPMSVTAVSTDAVSAVTPVASAVTFAVRLSIAAIISKFCSNRASSNSRSLRS